MTDVAGLLDQLFEGRTYAQGNHPETSHAAANDVGVMSQAASDEQRCYRLIVAAGNEGCTSDELSAVLEEGGRIIPPNQVSSRVGSLRDQGLVVDSGEQRMTRRNRRATVWVAV